MTDRISFEAWATSCGFSVDKSDDGAYRTKTTDAMWGGWLAGVDDAVKSHSKACADWARICEYGKRHGAKVGAQECANIIRGHYPNWHTESKTRKEYP